MTYRYAVDFLGGFARREAVLKAAGIEYKFDGTDIALEREFKTYSHREQALLTFARNPLVALPIFSGLDKPAAMELARVISETYTLHAGEWE
jgi:hypothetical protein